MRRRNIAVLAAAGTLAVTGAGVAVATSGSDDAKQREDAVLSDAAKRLGVDPDKLRSALSDAENAQIDADVKAGRLTQEQADAIKRHKAEDGLVLGPGGPPRGPGFRGRFGGPHGPPGPFGGPGEMVDAAAKAVGITPRELFSELRSGKSIAEIAEQHGKSLADVESAVRAAVKKHLDEEVSEGHLTQDQADEILGHVGDRLDELGSFKLRFRGPHP
jgi:transposase-like protein